MSQSKDDKNTKEENENSSEDTNTDEENINENKTIKEEYIDEEIERRAGEYKIVKHTKHIKVYFEKQFDKRDKIKEHGEPYETESESDNSNKKKRKHKDISGRKDYDLYAFVKVRPNAVPGEDNVLLDSDLIRIADEKNMDVEYYEQDQYWQPVFIMKEEDIKDEYIEGENEDELMNSRYTALKIEYAYKDKKKKEIHRNDCECRKCTEKKTNIHYENSDSDSSE